MTQTPPSIPCEGKTLGFIADLHLCEESPDRVNVFVRNLKNLCQHVDSLFILGDLFHHWIGDDDDNRFIRTVISALQQASEHCTIYIMQGNHDFLLGSRFAKKTRCHLIPDPTIIVHDKQPLLLTHGDLLCTRNRTYQRLRKLYFNPILQRLFLMLPLRTRHKIATKFTQHQTGKEASPSGYSTQTVAKWFKDNPQCLFMIHGHLHRSYHQGYFLNRRHYQEISLRAAMYGWTVCIHQDGELFLATL